MHTTHFAIKPCLAVQIYTRIQNRSIWHYDQYVTQAILDGSLYFSKIIVVFFGPVIEKKIMPLTPFDSNFIDFSRSHDISIRVHAVHNGISG